MAIVLSHISALEYWLSVRVGSRSFAKVSHAKALLAKPLAGDLGTSLGPWWLPTPLHVLVARDSQRRGAAGYAYHVWVASLPKGSLLDTRNGFYVCSPELCFLQMASTLSLVELIQLGFELCGTYDLDSGEVKKCAPLTTVAKLAALIEQIPNVNGRKKAVRALGFIGENSASPKETELAMLQCLPQRLGGRGFEMPLLNYRIDVNAFARKLTKKSYFVADMCWPAYRLIVEYDSDRYHEGARRKASDSARRNALEAMGYTVVTVTLDTVTSKDSVAEVAQALARHMGRRLRYSEPGFGIACAKLRTELFSGRRYGMRTAAKDRGDS